MTVAHFAAGYLRTCAIGYKCHPQYSLFSGWDSQTPLHTSMSVRRTWLGQAHCWHVMWQVIGHSGAQNFLNVALKCYSVITIGISAWNLLWSQLLTKGFNRLRSNILLQLYKVLRRPGNLLSSQARCRGRTHSQTSPSPAPPKCKHCDHSLSLYFLVFKHCDRSLSLRFLGYEMKETSFSTFTLLELNGHTMVPTCGSRLEIWSISKFK